jgi:hypothetical protein
MHMQKVGGEGMTSDQLKIALGIIQQGLTANKEVIQPALLTALRSFLNELRVHPATQQIVGQLRGNAYAQGVYNDQLDADKLLAGLDRALDVEEKLIGQEGDTMIKVCSGLQSRPMFLGILARFI